METCLSSRYYSGGVVEREKPLQSLADGEPLFGKKNSALWGNSFTEIKQFHVRDFPLPVRT
jgi:hypothetical protein